MVNELHFDILGASFSITVDEDEPYLQKVMIQYEAAVKNTQSISGINEPLNIAILTGYMLCDEINKMRRQLEEEFSKKDNGEEREVQERTLRLLANLDSALKICGE